ncbi:MAG: hypothetical protein ACLS8R_03445 [Anaeromassilibacillus sp.]
MIRQGDRPGGLGDRPADKTGTTVTFKPDASILRTPRSMTARRCSACATGLPGAGVHIELGEN